MLDKQILSETYNLNVVSYNEKTEIMVYRDSFDSLLWFKFNKYEIIFDIRDYLRTKSIEINLNQSLEDIIKDINNVYEIHKRG